MSFKNLLGRFKYWLGRSKFLIGILISVVFLYFFMRKLDWLAVWQIVKSVKYGYLFLAFMVHMVAFTCRAKRWQYLLAPLKKIGLGSVFTATIICFMGNNIFPARLGEFIRVYVLSTREDISKSACMATIVVERLMDGFTVIMFLIGLLWFFPFPAGSEHSALIKPLKITGLISGVVYIGIVLFLIMAKFHPQRLLAWLSKIMPAHFYDRVAGLIESFVSGLDSLKRGKHLFGIAFFSIAVWVMVSVFFFTIYQAFDLQLPFSSSILLMVAVALAVSVPSSPGYVGTLHFAAAACLMLLGVEPTMAKSFALILHAMIFIPVTLLGLIFVYREKLNLKKIQGLEDELSHV